MNWNDGLTLIWQLLGCWFKSWKNPI